MLVEQCGAALRVEPRGLELRLRLAQMRGQDADTRLVPGQIGFARDVLLRQALRAGEDARRVLQVGIDHPDRGLGGLGARLRQREILLGEHAVEPGDHLPGLTVMPSSIITSTTLPVISDAIVALRRATTKPDATRLPARRGSALAAGACGAVALLRLLRGKRFGAAGEAQLRREQRKRDHGCDRGAGGRDQHRPTPPRRPRRGGPVDRQ